MRPKPALRMCVLSTSVPRWPKDFTRRTKTLIPKLWVTLINKPMKNLCFVFVFVVVVVVVVVVAAAAALFYTDKNHKWQ